MKLLPHELIIRDELNLRHGIKSSLSKLRSVVAILYIIYKANDKEPIVNYTEEYEDNGATLIRLNSSIKSKVESSFPDISKTDLNELPIFTSQIEALQVGIELFLKLGKIVFSINSYPNSIERTRGNRYNKTIRFGANIKHIDIFLSAHNDENVKQFLLKWLKNEVSDFHEIENGMSQMLTIFSEETQFKMRSQTGEIFFQQEGIYNILAKGNTVDSNDIHELVGPFRIFKSFIKENIHPFLEDDKTNGFKLRGDINISEFIKYQQLVSTSLDLIPRRIVISTGVDNPEIDNPTVNIESLISSQSSTKSFQKIYYGAPGTGKSYRIKEQLKGVPKENIFRTTFHPDSDYSTFVGSYKPTLSKKPLYGLNGGLTVRLNDGKDLDEETITYRFISQAFLNAYMQAYIKPDEDVYLIIEEINRGNCAQIFGDLFQLLDRDENGVSEYTIKADADLNGFLEKALGEDSDAIKNGELCLPSNLYIYATMNTSDQSLFPIDSAFKRRWDWEYEPIKYRNTDWMIDIQGRRYSWVSFQKEINTRIFDATKSEDKMLGDYFVNPGNKVITDKMLLNKILFYLWNDVCKDGEGDIFKTSDIEDVSFSDLYGDGGIEKLINMMGYLGVEEFEEIDDDIDGEEVDDEDSGSQKEKDRTKYSINGYGKYPKKKLAAELVKLYVAKNQSMSAQEVVDKWKSLGQFVSHFIETQAEFDKRTDKPRKEDVKIGSEFIYVSTNGWGGKGIMDKLINAIPKDWNLNVEEVQ